MNDPYEISVVVPVYNEEENIERCSQEINDALKGHHFEVIWVDDGSKDKSPSILKSLAKQDTRNKVILFRRNYGQTAAMAAGFDHAQGTVICPMDSDLQNDPRDIIRLIEVLNQGYDVVSGWRQKRKDNIIRRIPSIIANRIIGRATGTHIHDYGCTLKAYSKSILKDVNLYGEMHRFIPALAAAQGAKVTELVVNHRPRVAGVSKYGLSRTFRVTLDVMTIVFLNRFITKPLHFFGALAMACFAVATVLAGVVLLEKFYSDVYVHRNPLFVIMSFAILGGFQFITTGLLGEVMARSYFESQGRTIYQVRERLNIMAKSRESESRFL